MASQVVHRDPEILGGEPVFWGTRVPVRNLLDCLEEGYSIDQFIDDFPTVQREQIVAFLEETKTTLMLARAA